jgi:hypothetical protein
MASNYLEQLVIEWYEYQGYFVRNNVLVGKRAQGGYETELDIVAFHPAKMRLVHLEPSMDADSWERREERYKKKFELGRIHIPGLFAGLSVPKEIEQIAVFGYASKISHNTIGGGKVVCVEDLFRDIINELKAKTMSNSAISEHMPLLRTLQFVCEYKKLVRELLS